jgi:hypothetical protein
MLTHFAQKNPKKNIFHRNTSQNGGILIKNECLDFLNH